jgi:hypothetical protein
VLEIFLVPVGRARHELYCETRSDEDATAGDEPANGWVRRQVARFRAMLAEAEDERVRSERGEVSEKRGMTKWVVGKLAETIAEQRLLWQLRRADAARLTHPAGRPGEDAMRIARAHFTADYGKHRRWLAIDALVASITGPVFFVVPGPNVISWYFAFRALGHFYAMQGARRALDHVRWDTRASQELQDIDAALGLERTERRARLDEIANALGLNALSGFVERVAQPRP